MLNIIFAYGISAVRLSRSSAISPLAINSFFDYSFASLNCCSFRWEQRNHFSKFPKAYDSNKKVVLWKDPLNFKKTYSSEDIKVFVQRIKKSGIIIEPKVDGFACLLYYKNGKLNGAQTKHEKLNPNIINCVNRLNCVPKKLKKNFSGLIRGELFVSHRAFSIINKRRIKYDFKIYKNALSVLLSSLMSKTGDTFIDNNIQFFGYYMQYLKSKPYEQSQIDTHDHLKKLGFKCDLPEKFRIFKDTKKALKYIKDVKSRRSCCSAQIDGMVIKILEPDSYKNSSLEKLYPSLAYGFKFKPRIQSAKVINITPVIFNGVQLGVVAHVEPTKFSNGKTLRKLYIRNRKAALLLREKDIVAVHFLGNVPVLQKILRNKKKILEIPIIFWNKSRKVRQCASF
jgi:DNA ligase (NAD+)